MTITRVNEIWQGRNGSDSAGGERTYSRVFRVLTDSNFDTVVEATANGTPVFGDLFPSDNEAFCQKVSGTQEAFSPRVWIITCSYSNKRVLLVNPLNDPTVFTWGTQQFQRPYFKDRDGFAILNSAGDPFDPPVEGDDSRTSVTMVRNVATVPVWFLKARDRLNSTTYTIDGITINSERAKIQKVSAGKQEKRNGVSFRTISTTMYVQDDSWQKSILDAGFRLTSPILGGARVHILNGDGTQVTSPVPLDGTGDKIEEPTPANAVFLDFDIYNTFDFNTLPF